MPGLARARFKNPIARPKAWLGIGLAGLGLLFLACREPGIKAPSISSPAWGGVPLKMRWASRDSLLERFQAFLPAEEPLPEPLKQTYWEQEGADLTIGVSLWEFSGIWQATRAWQALAGDRDPVGKRVFARGSHWILAGITLAQIDKSGPQLLSADEVERNLTLGGWEPGKEPAFSQVFLQRRRLPFSGSALPDNYLGLPWSTAVYGMHYAWYGDTAQVVVAGPQDSVFQVKWALFHRKSQGQPEISPQPQVRVRRGPRDWFWAMGPLGVVGMQGCYAAKACSTWVEEQYQVLRIFERDGFFPRKNASLN